MLIVIPALVEVAVPKPKQGQPHREDEACRVVKTVLKVRIFQELGQIVRLWIQVEVEVVDVELLVIVVVMTLVGMTLSLIAMAAVGSVVSPWGPLGHYLGRRSSTHGGHGNKKRSRDEGSPDRRHFD